MRVGILTTETPHHVFFVRRIAEAYPLAAVIEETEQVSAPFETFHPFERQREVYEWRTWFNGRRTRLSEVEPVTAFRSMNSPDAMRHIRNLRLDLAIVFGTGRLGQGVIDAVPGHLLNLHGGDPECYRGLDSHLWAIYHRDFGALRTCLHVVQPALDDGAVVDIESICIRPGMALYELRRFNTEICVDLVLRAIAELSRSGTIEARPQAAIGRYYSFMPSVLKDLCVRRFHAYTSKIAKIGNSSP